MQHPVAIEPDLRISAAPLSSPRNRNSPMIMPSALWRMHGIPSIPDILSALELRGDVAGDDLTWMHGVFSQYWCKVSGEVWMDRGLTPLFPFSEHCGWVDVVLQVGPMVRRTVGGPYSTVEEGQILKLFDNLEWPQLLLGDFLTSVSHLGAFRVKHEAGASGRTHDRSYRLDTAMVWMVYFFASSFTRFKLYPTFLASPHKYNHPTLKSSILKCPALKSSSQSNAVRIHLPRSGHSGPARPLLVPLPPQRL
jgi:hypothetical protein